MVRRSGGFTLVEVLVAVFLGALVMGVLASIYFVGAEALGRGREQSDALQSGRFLLSLCSGDLQNAYISKMNARLIMAGDKNSIRFISADPENGLRLFWYRFDRQTSAVYRDITHDLNADAWVRPKNELLGGVADLSFRYYDSERRIWYEQWDSRYSKRLPDLVEIRLALATGREPPEVFEFPPMVCRLSVSRVLVGPRLRR